MKYTTALATIKGNETDAQLEALANAIVKAEVSQQKQEKMVEELKKKFGSQFWVKPGYMWDEGGSQVLWSGEGSFLPTGENAFNYYAFESDPKEETYIGGVHKSLIEWAEKYNLRWEPYDAGTFLAYQD